MQHTSKIALGLMLNTFKIYSNIYGQHNRNWTNLINFMEKQLKPNHGFLLIF